MSILFYLFPCRFIVKLKDLASDMFREFCDILSTIACYFQSAFRELVTWEQ